MNLRTTLPALALVLAAALACGADGGVTREPARRAPSDSRPDPSLLVHGWPTPHELGSDGTVEGPGRAVDPPRLQACGGEVVLDAGDRFTAVLSGIEDYRVRVLATYPDESGAVAATAALLDLYRDCPREPQDALVKVNEVAGDPTSRSGASVRTSFRYDGADAIGLQVLVVFRRGADVVVSLVSNEGMGRVRALGMAREQAHQLQPLLEALD